MRHGFFYLFMGIFFLLLNASRAQALRVEERCDHEWEGARNQGGVSQGEVTHDMSKGRHQWLLKCGLITNEDLSQMQALSFTSDHFYSFVKGNDILSIAPFDATAPCEPEEGWRFLATCPHGCFESSEPLLFDGQWMSIPLAFEQSQTHISTLASGSSPLRPVIKEHVEIKRFTKGKEINEMVSIYLANRMHITVTKNHPLILGTGEVIPAEAVHEGQHLLTTEGPSKLIKITSRRTADDVWNVEPVSDHYLDNVFIASGILTGSLRFQNEWADFASRNFVKNSLTAEKLEAFEVSPRDQE